MSSRARLSALLCVVALTAGCAGPSLAGGAGGATAVPQTHGAPTGSADTSASASPAPTAPASSPATTTAAATQQIDRSVKVAIRAPLYDAPGGLVAIIPTARGAKSFEVSVAGRAGECTGPTWTHATGTSQQCWITLPTNKNRQTITARAHLAGGKDAVGTQPIEGRGVVSKAVDAATRDRIFTCGNTTDEVWLTFDDGFLSEKTMNRVLDTLERENVRAHFFANGNWARTNPSMTQALLRDGHLVENHTDTHESLNAISDSALQAQIDRGPATHATLMRPGFGAGAFTTRVSEAAESAGQSVCYWNVDTRDWAGPTADQIVARVIDGDRGAPPAQPGSVVLMHMTGKHTPEALPTLIERLRAKGLTLPALRD